MRPSPSADDSELATRKKTLKLLENVIAEYSSEHKGVIPESLEEAVRSQGGNLKELIKNVEKFGIVKYQLERGVAGLRYREIMIQSVPLIREHIRESAKKSELVLLSDGQVVFATAQ